MVASSATARCRSRPASDEGRPGAASPVPVRRARRADQGMIGYWQVQALETASPGRRAACLICRTMVKADDRRSGSQPSSSGRGCPEAEAQARRLSAEHGWADPTGRDGPAARGGSPEPAATGRPVHRDHDPGDPGRRLGQAHSCSGHHGAAWPARRLGAALGAQPRELFVISTKIGRILEACLRPAGSDREAGGFAVPATLRRRFELQRRRGAAQPGGSSLGVGSAGPGGGRGCARPG